ncbi:MAG: metallophosphoesterase family protein, partial [Patescibacteria group bacterium]
RHPWSLPFAFLLIVIVLSSLYFAQAQVIISSPPTTPLSPATHVGQALADCSVVFIIEETLAHPTKKNITLTVMPAETADLYVEYGKDSGVYTSSTLSQRISAGVQGRFLLDGLEPGKRYFYRLRCKNTASSTYDARPEYSFRTLRGGNATFSFIVFADSHLYALYTRANNDNVCGTNVSGFNTAKTSLLYFNQSLQNFLPPDVDFVLVGGDEAMTHCPTCSQCMVRGEDSGVGTVGSLREAELRYELILSPTYYGQVTKYLPVFYKLGNHDGEPGFSDAVGTCDNYDTLLNYSQQARLRYVPNASDVYPGGPSGSYYSFSSGNAQFIILDVMNGPTQYPQQASDWTLGPDQLAWLETVLTSTKKQWTFIFAEHLVGGLSDPAGHCYYYGRGGLKATDNGELNGTFLGEQARLDDLMNTYNATVFFSSHDHVALAGEKRDATGQGEGVYYVTSGKSSNIGGAWLSQSWFVDTMDYDNNGIADYLEGRWGSDHSGFFKVTVQGSEQVDVAYLGSDYQNMTNNGQPLFSFTVYANGSSTLPPF